MNTDLIIVRIKGFVYELVAMVLTGVGAWLLDFFGSDVFRALVTEHFGATAIGGLILLAVSGIVKHVRNLRVLGGWKKLGGYSVQPDLI